MRELLRAVRTRGRLTAALPYALIALAYFGLGLLLPEAVLGWPVGLLLWFLGPWALPALVRRIRQ